MITRHLLISGRVQGVYFRESMRREADRLGIRGWVRNLADGRVEAIVQGRENVVEAIIEWAHTGPPAAKVSQVEISATDGQFDHFERR